MKKLSIDLMKIDRARIRTTMRRDGSTTKFLDLILIERKDDFGNDGFCTQSTTREERESGLKLPVLGNWTNLKPKSGSDAVPSPSVPNTMSDEDIIF
jgi:hypothetical protein